MSSKHRPGPWAVTPHPQTHVDVFGVGVIRDDKEFQYGLSHTFCYQNAEANARLIAAAPDLLEALERIARPHDCGCVPCTGQCRSQIALEIAVEEMQELARAAIAKATGGAQ
ncbi:hypothetical protein RYH75_11280 [Stenotrophomonas geniculata]|uniref:hypothetical protein n=1 Tax=Stenotrophomonas geniculata TaxID=86188 RepID=UPI002949B778|nr:hypothetical protein [Stenotrophomonas geniculata]MDV6189835.1 hypothetical protein [Stenotrophomonas geniculata]